MAESKKEMEDRIGTCSVVRDEILGGEPATLFNVRNKSEGTADVQMWIFQIARDAFKAEL